jgi:hypothetical protein
VPRTKLWNMLEEIKVPKLRFVSVRPYEKVISRFRNTEGWLEEINCNIGFKQGCPLSLTLFGIYIDKLKYFLEDVGCVDMTLMNIVIILPFYVYDIVLMEKIPYDLSRQLITLKDFYSSMVMTVNTDKTKVIIIKSKGITYNTSFYENNNLEEVPSYNYLGIYIHQNLNWNYSIEKRINGGWKDYYGLKNNCKSADL